MATPPTLVAGKLKAAIKAELASEIEGGDITITADNVSDTSTKVMMTAGERETLEVTAAKLPNLVAPGFAAPFLDALARVAGGVRDDGTLDFLAARFGTVNGAQASDIAGAAQVIRLALDVPGFALALLALDYSVAGGVRDDGTLDVAALQVGSVGADAAALAAATIQAAAITTLNGHPVDALIGAIGTATDFTPALRRSDMTYPVRARAAFLTAPAQAGGAGGWYASAGTFTVDNAVTVGGRSTLRYEGTTDDFPNVYVAFPSRPLTVQGRIMWRFKTDPAIGGTFSMVAGYSSDAPNADPPTTAPTNRRAVVIQPTHHQVGVWNSYVADVAAVSMTPGGGTAMAWTDTGSPNATLMQLMRAVPTFPTGSSPSTRKIWFDRIAIGGLAQPFVLITFDGAYSGGSADKIGYVLKAMRDRGLVATQYMDGDAIASNRGLLDQLYAAGWDVAQQGIAHKNYTSAAAGADQAAREATLSADWDTADAALVAAGYLTARDCFAWPQAAHNAGLDAVLYAKGVRHSRGGNAPPRIVVAEDGSPEVINAGTLTTTCHYGTDGTSITSAQMISWTTDAILHGTGYCALTHGVVSGSATTGTETTGANWLAWLDDLAAKRDAGKLLVLTASQYLRMTACPRPLYDD